MPDIAVGAQIFDVVFHPTESHVYTALLTGEIKSFSYDGQGQHTADWTVKPSKRSCRGLSINEDGSTLWACGKSKAIYTIDTATGKISETRAAAHDAPLNRLKCVMPWLVASGDDEGVIKLWDPRQQESIRSYTQHFDYITDFLWLPDKKHLVATSGDSTLSVMDVRSKSTDPFAHSEDQEDELLSIVSIKGGTKIVVGTQTGILSVFNRSSGWGDCVDRVPGHPYSIDALCGIPSRYPAAESTILTGSSDGMLRAVQILPTKLVGVVADHGAFPIERIVIDKLGEGRWVASAGHDDSLKMTDLNAVFEDDDKNGAAEEEMDGEEEDDVDFGAGGDDDEDSDEDKEEAGEELAVEDVAEEDVDDDDDESGDASDEPQEKKRKRGKDRDPLARQTKKNRNEVDADPSFFSEL